MSLPNGAAGKGVARIYIDAWRPDEKRHRPWVDRCNQQMHGALAELENTCTAAKPWRIGTKICQARFTAGGAATLCSDTVGFGHRRYPALNRLIERCEAMPEFKSVRVPFFTPNKS